MPKLHCFEVDKAWKCLHFIKGRVLFCVHGQKKKHDFFVKNASVEVSTPLTVDSFEKLPFISVHEKYCFLERSADFQFNAAFKSSSLALLAKELALLAKELALLAKELRSRLKSPSRFS